MPKPNAWLNTTDDLRHTWEQVAWGRQVTGNGVAPEASAMGPWTPSEPEAAAPVAGLNGEVLAPEASAASAATPTMIEGQIIEGNVHDHADFYGTIWGNGGAAQVEGPTIDAPEIAAPAIEPPAPDQGDDLTPG